MGQITKERLEPLSEKEIKAQYKKGTRSVKKRIKKAGARVKIRMED